jgi:hypothetical protein
MKTVTDKYLEMNHNFIELRDSIMQKIKDEKPMENGMLNNVFIAMGVLNNFLDIYKEMNEVKTKTKENDKIENNNVEESADDKTDNDCVILSNPNAWKSVKE